MPSFTTWVEILEHTPRWVWVALVAIVAAGIAQLRPRRATPARATVLPVLLATLSLLGILAGFAGPAAPAGWAVGMMVATTLGMALGAPSGAGWHAAERRLALPGSWLPLALMLGLFATRFAVGVLVARSPALRHAAEFGGTAGLACGAFSGLLLGRALAFRALARPAPAAAGSAA